VDNNYLDLGMNKSVFVHTLPSGRLTDPSNRGINKANTVNQLAINISFVC
jgi:hypothetical protein